MSLQQVKEIIRKPWAATDDDGGAGEARPKPSSAKSPRSACLPIRIPVRITIRNSSGVAELSPAVAILLNQRGARFECSTGSGQRPSQQNPFKLNETLWIEVLATGKAAGGNVVWADKRPNAGGKFEFTVELRDSGNLFDVEFLRQDPEPPETAKQSDYLTGTQAQRAAENVKSDTAASSQLTSAAVPSGNTSSARPQLVENSAADEPMTDRLAELFKEVIQTAVRKEEDAASVRIVKEVKDEVGQVQQTALENLRKGMTQQVSVLEDQLLQQCRARTEQMLSTVMKTALQALSNEMDEMAARTEERIQGIFSNLVNQLEERSAKVLAESGSKIQAQVENSAKGIHGAIVHKVLSDISEKQKNMLEQVQQQIGMATEQNLVKLRSGLIRALQELTQSNQNGKLAI